MKYIVVSKNNLTVDVVEDYPKSGFVVPVKLKAMHRKLSPLESVIYHKILYPARYEEDKIKYPHLKQKGIYERYKLIEPPPWMIAMAYIMWEGIIQGLTWDVANSLVGAAMTKLVSIGVAPGTVPGTKEVEKKTEVGFAWAKYSTEGRKQRDMFIGLKRVYKKISEDQRQDIANSVIMENS